MSYFTEMFKSKEYEKYLWEVNKYGEIVVSLLDKEDKRVTFVSMHSRDIPAFLGSNDFYVIRMRPGLFGYDSWKSVADILNGKHGSRYAVCVAIRDIVWSAFDEYFKWDEMSKKWLLTRKAQDEDKK